MTCKDIYVQLVKNEIRLSEALALTLIETPLTEDESKWISSEISGYDQKQDLPEYRQFPCKIKARVLSHQSGEISDIELSGGGLDNLNEFLMRNFRLSIYKLYLTQGIEWVENQALGHKDGNLVMMFEAGPAEELKQSLASDAAIYNFSVQEVFQTVSVHSAHNLINVVKNKLLTILKNYLKTQQNEPHEYREGVRLGRKRIFISYCWESEEHKKWVHKLAEDLSEEFEVKIDQKQPLGVELTHFMEKAIASSDKVLIITTPEYKNRADNRISGVGYEASLITDELVTEQNKIKFIPIIRVGTKEESFPKYLGSRKGLDMTDNDRYQECLDELKGELLEF